MEILTKKQINWLSTHGDRSEDDVRQDGKGFYVFMVGKGGKPKRVYLPREKYISKEELSKPLI